MQQAVNCGTPLREPCRRKKQGKGDLNAVTGKARSYFPHPSVRIVRNGAERRLGQARHSQMSDDQSRVSEQPTAATQVPRYCPPGIALGVALDHDPASPMG